MDGLFLAATTAITRSLRGTATAKVNMSVPKARCKVGPDKLAENRAPARAVAMPDRPITAVQRQESALFKCSRYDQAPTIPVAATAAKAVPCAACCDMLMPVVKAGIMTKAPPNPAKEEIMPAAVPMVKAWIVVAASLGTTCTRMRESTAELSNDDKATGEARQVVAVEELIRDGAALPLLLRAADAKRCEENALEEVATRSIPTAIS